LRSHISQWRDNNVGAGQRRPDYKTPSQIPVKEVYTPEDLPDSDYLRDAGLPGEYPYLRGVHPTGYRARLWTMRMFAGFGLAEETNERFKVLLGNGETGLSVAFDMPTLYGYDTDDPRAAGEFGTCGVAISTMADMETLFDGISYTNLGRDDKASEDASRAIELGATPAELNRAIDQIKKTR